MPPGLGAEIKAPGGRFGLYWAPGGKQTNLYIVATHSGVTLRPEGPGSAGPRATLFSGYPRAAGGYTALSLTVNGRTATRQELTYLGNGKVALRPEGKCGPTSRQLWKIG